MEVNSRCSEMDGKCYDQDYLALPPATNAFLPEYGRWRFKIDAERGKLCVLEGRMDLTCTRSCNLEQKKTGMLVPEAFLRGGEGVTV